MKLQHSFRAPGARGFTLVEVMVSLIVISVGLLGIASMQGLALSSASNARMRSLAAIEAASLAATMHTNRAYWAVSAPGSFTVVDGLISDAGLASGTANCTSSGTLQCAPATLAAYDTQRWVAALDTLLPHPSATITCPITSVPMSCTIYITWTESAVAINKQEAATAGTQADFQKPDYTLYVQP